MLGPVSSGHPALTQIMSFLPARFSIVAARESSVLSERLVRPTASPEPFTVVSSGKTMTEKGPADLPPFCCRNFGLLPACKRMPAPKH